MLCWQPGGSHCSQGEGDGRQACSSQVHWAITTEQHIHRGRWSSGASDGPIRGLSLPICPFLWKNCSQTSPQGTVEDSYDHHGEDSCSSTNDWQGCESLLWFYPDDYRLFMVFTCILILQLLFQTKYGVVDCMIHFFGRYFPLLLLACVSVCLTIGNPPLSPPPHCPTTDDAQEFDWQCEESCRQRQDWGHVSPHQEPTGRRQGRQECCVQYHG